MQLACNIMRGKAIESQHIVYAVMINEQNEILFSAALLDESYFAQLHVPI